MAVAANPIAYMYSNISIKIRNFSDEDKKDQNYCNLVPENSNLPGENEQQIYMMLIGILDVVSVLLWIHV